MARYPTRVPGHFALGNGGEMTNLIAGISLGYIVAVIGPMRLSRMVRQSFKKKR